MKQYQSNNQITNKTNLAGLWTGKRSQEKIIGSLDIQSASE